MFSVNAGDRRAGEPKIVRNDRETEKGAEPKSRSPYGVRLARRPGRPARDQAASAFILSETIATRLLSGWAISPASLRTASLVLAVSAAMVSKAEVISSL